MKKSDLALVKGAGIRIADQNHYDYDDFAEWLAKMWKPIMNKIKKDPHSVPYFPQYVKNEDMYKEPFSYDTKKEMILDAKYWFYLFGLESKYTYKRNSNNKVKYFMYADFNKSSKEWYHPITFQWWTGIKPKKS